MAKKYSSPEECRAKLQEKTHKREIFFNSFRNATALFLGCAVVFSSTVIAYNKVNYTSSPVLPTEKTDGSSNIENTTSAQVNKPSQNSTSNISTQIDNTNSTASQSGNNSADSNTNKPSSTEQSNGLTTQKEQYEYFIKSFNGVKGNAKTAENYKKKGINYKGIAEAGSMSKLLSSLMKTFLKEEEPKDAVYSGKDIMAKFPPAGTTCNLKQSDIEKITCEDQGKYYVIKITVKGSEDPEAGTGVGSIASVITRDQIMDPIKHIPGLKNLNPTCNYENSSCEAKIEKATGNMVEYVFDLPLILSFKEQQLRVGLEFFEWWRMTY